MSCDNPRKSRPRRSASCAYLPGKAQQVTKETHGLKVQCSKYQISCSRHGTGFSCEAQLAAQRKSLFRRQHDKADHPPSQAGSVLEPWQENVDVRKPCSALQGIGRVAVCRMKRTKTTRTCITPFGVVMTTSQNPVSDENAEKRHQPLQVCCQQQGYSKAGDIDGRGYIVATGTRNEYI